MRLLFVVDYQYDFVAEDGKLTAGKPAQDIEQNIYQKIKTYQDRNDPIIYTMDAHTDDDFTNKTHPEGNIFTAHCIKDSIGYELYGSIKDAATSQYMIDKRAYCPDFSSKGIIDLVYQAETIEVCGVVTDICAFQTVIGLYTHIVNQGLQIPILVDSGACASFHSERQTWALTYLKEVLGVLVS